MQRFRGFLHLSSGPALVHVWSLSLCSCWERPNKLMFLTLQTEELNLHCGPQVGWWSINLTWPYGPMQPGMPIDMRWNQPPTTVHISSNHSQRFQHPGRIAVGKQRYGRMILQSNCNQSSACMRFSPLDSSPLGEGHAFPCSQIL